MKKISSLKEYALKTKSKIAIRIAIAEFLLNEGYISSPNEYLDILNGEI